ncbi:MAG: hypothetical protein D6798_00855 [Deltaproteobacteria bacterium]|nr:MAG: hypothetical protein D6798_00855 [Deltaproteobacteria bacterium]
MPVGCPDERRTWWVILASIRRAWAVFLLVALLGAAASVAASGTGSEYVAVAEVVAVAPPSANSLMDSARRHYDALAGIVKAELESDQYRNEVFPPGSDGLITVDVTTNWPVVIVQVRASRRQSAIAAVERATADFVGIVEREQVARGVVPVARLRAAVGAVHLPPPRPPASKRAVAALVLATLFVAAAAARAVDQLGVMRR